MLRYLRYLILLVLGLCLLTVALANRAPVVVKAARGNDALAAMRAMLKR